MTHEKLYTRDSVGNIREWWIDQSEEKYRIHSGILDGKIVTSKWTVAKPKNVGKSNATTAPEQASIEIGNKYKKQLKTGYTQDLDKVDEVKTIPVMLAKKYSEYKDKVNLSSNEWLLQLKMNGMRCIANKNGLFTRKGEKYISVPHIEKSLKSFFEKYPYAVLDGELFNVDLRQQLNEISKLIRKTKHISAEDYSKSEQMIRFYIYDGFGFGELSIEAPYELRKDWIDMNVISEYVYTEEVESIPIDSYELMMSLYEDFIEDGHEGGILRKKDMPYEDKRSKLLLKVKPENDDECVILDIHDAKGNWSGLAKTATIQWKDKVFDATFKGSQKEMKKVWEEKDSWIGQTVTFLYIDFTGLGVPTSARIDVNNCFKGDR